MKTYCHPLPGRSKICFSRWHGVLQSICRMHTRICIVLSISQHAHTFMMSSHSSTLACNGSADGAQGSDTHTPTTVSRTACGRCGCCTQWQRRVNARCPYSLCQIVQSCIESGRVQVGMAVQAWETEHVSDVRCFSVNASSCMRSFRIKLLHAVQKQI